MAKMNEIFDRAKEKAVEVAENAKGYDYKGKANELKEKAAEATEKARDYDYKGKAEEIKNAVSSYDYEGKAKAVKESVKNFDYKGSINTIKNDKGKLKKIIIGIAAVVAVILVFTVVGNIRNAMNLTPEAAIDNFFTAIEKAADMAQEQGGNEATKYLYETLDYEIVSVEENDDSAVAVLEIECVDMAAVKEAMVSELMASGGNMTSEEQSALMGEIIKEYSKKPVKKNVGVELTKVDGKWIISSESKVQAAIFGE